jgi:hypothetical protein
MKMTTARGPALLGAAVLVAILLAACGGGGSSSTSTTASKASATNAAATQNTTPANGATGGAAASRTALVACLKKYGVTLPNFGGGFGGRFGATGASGRRFGFGATGASGRRFGFGATGASGRRFAFGATGASGRAGGFPGPGTGAGGFAGNPKLSQALAKCGGFGGAGGFGRFGATGRSGAFNFSTRVRAQLTSFVACMKKHGETLPAPNVSGTGSIFGNVNEKTASFKAAYTQCKGIIASFLKRPRVPTGPAAPPAA